MNILVFLFMLVCHSNRYNLYDIVSLLTDPSTNPLTDKLCSDKCIDVYLCLNVPI